MRERLQPLGLRGCNLESRDTDIFTLFHWSQLSFDLKKKEVAWYISFKSCDKGIRKKMLMDSILFPRVMTPKFTCDTIVEAMNYITRKLSLSHSLFT